MNRTKPLHGLVPAPFTPFHPDQTLRLDVVPAYARLLAANGVAAVFVCGTTGEGPSLTTDERFRVAEAWTGAGAPGLRVVVHAGHTSAGEAARLASHAREIGADAVSAMAPYFFRPGAVGDLADWCAPIAAAAAPLPFYYYHIPSFTGVGLPMGEFLAEAGPRIPNLAGVKFTFEDLADYRRCLAAEGGRFDIVFGRDELLLDALRAGARGAIGSTYNYAAPLYARLIEAFAAGDAAEAAALQETAVRMIALCNGLEGVTHLAASKTLMASLGVDCGPVRLPLRQPSPEEASLLRRRLEAIAFSSFACQALSLAEV